MTVFKSLILPLLALTLPAFAETFPIQYENVRFKQLGGKEGLPHNTVFAIAQDQAGFIWMATASGLCRYDGYDIGTLRHSDSDTTSLRHDFVRNLFNDDGRKSLWLSTDTGICRYDYSRERFSNYGLGGSTDDIVDFLFGPDGKTLLAVCDIGIFRYDDETDDFTLFLGPRTPGKHFQTAVIDSHSIMWIGSGEGLLRYDLGQERYTGIPDSITGLGDGVVFTDLAGDRFVILSNDDICLVYDTRDGSVRDLGKDLKDKTYRCSETDSAGNIWVGCEYGIYVYDREWNVIAHFEQSPGDLSGLNDSPTYSIFRDKNGNMWAGTYFGGVNYFLSGSDQFKYRSYGNGNDHLSGKAVRQIANTPEGGLMLATEDGGLNYIDPDGRIHSDILSRLKHIEAKNIHSLLVDEDGSLWIGLFLKGILHWRKDGEIEDYNAPLKSVSSAFDIARTADGCIWYAGPSGLFRIDRRKSNVPERISPLRYPVISVLNDTTILMGARIGGLYTADTRSLKVEARACLPEEAHVTDIFPDSSGSIWVATDQDGLYEIDPGFNIVNAFKEDRLGSNSVKSIIEDREGNFWAGTGNGLVCISGDCRKCTRYTASDGLPSTQFNYTAACIRPDGELCFGTVDGMISFHPEKVRKEGQAFRIAVTGIAAGGKYIDQEDGRIISGAMGFPVGITLKYRDAKSLQIDYSGMNYKYGRDTEYAMMLSGVDKHWQLIGKQRQVRLTGLRPGRYTFRIAAGCDGDNWDKDGMLSLKLRILPPWYASPAACILYALLSLVALRLIYKWYKARLMLRMRLEAEHERRLSIEKMNRLKTDFFTYVSHDLKTPLTLILSPLRRMLDNPGLKDEDRNNLSIILRNANRMNYLVNELLTFSKIEMNQKKILLRQGDIISFIGETTAIFGMVAREKDIEFRTELQASGKAVWFSPSNLERILFNLLSNAFKYTAPGGRVTLEASLSGNGSKALITVTDTGRGIPEDALGRIFDSYYQVERKDHREGFGLGLALTKSLIKMHKGDIGVSSKVGEGTSFTVTLSVSETAFGSGEYSTESITDDEIDKYRRRIQDSIDLVPEKLSPPSSETVAQTLLIVEDNAEMNEYICGIFRETFNVKRAFNGKEALSVIGKGCPDIIVSDIMMPVMSGLEMLEAIRADVTTSHIPVILLTAKTDEDDHTEGYRSGADAYIDKPFNARNLELLVNNILEGRRRNLEHVRKMDTLNMKQITGNPRDEAFMAKLVGLINANMKEENFGVAEIMDGMNVSRSLLHMKIKALAGCSITQFIKTLKMKEAKKCLSEGMNVSEAAYAVGMSDPNYFTKCFKAEFGITPSEYIKSLGTE
ncbi:MAG: two-component regulator propeller domain-containing protein [Candidatus Cryptobacteroides sp.]